MDIAWGSAEAKTFITNVGLITSTGKLGNNIMAAEWTHQVSYSPGRIGVCINNINQETAANIRETKEFGVNIAATDQNMLASIAGNNKGHLVDKIKVLQEMGVTFTKGKKIQSLMVEGAALQIECTLIQEINLGSHTMFVGEALVVTKNAAKQSLAYHEGKYFALGNSIPKPPETMLEKIKKTLEKYKKS